MRYFMPVAAAAIAILPYSVSAQNDCQESVQAKAIFYLANHYKVAPQAVRLQNDPITYIGSDSIGNEVYNVRAVIPQSMGVEWIAVVGRQKHQCVLIGAVNTYQE